MTKTTKPLFTPPKVMSEVSAGIEPAYDPTYRRRVRFGGVMITMPGVYEMKTDQGVIPIVPDPLMAKGMFMFGGIPFNYNSEDFDQEDDVDNMERLKAKIEQQQKTIDRLTKLQAVNPENTIFVLKVPVGDGFSDENLEAFRKFLPKGSVVIVMPEDYNLEGMNEQDLADLGLQRAGQAMSEQQAYDLMLMGYKPR